MFATLLGSWRYIVGSALVVLMLSGIIWLQHKKIASLKANYSALENSYDQYKKNIADAQAIENSRQQSAIAALKKQSPIRTAKNKSASAVVSLKSPKGILACPAVDELINDHIQ